MRRRVRQAIVEGEEGHLPPFLATVIAGAGVIALGIGAANDTGWLAVTGSIVAGLGLVVYDVVRHRILDKEFYARTDELMKK